MLGHRGRPELRWLENTLGIGEFRLLVKELKAYQAQPAAASPPKAAAASVSVGSIFRDMDKDGSGELDVAECKAALNELGLAADTEGAAAVLQRYDADGNGKLSLPEFRLLVKELKKFQAA